MREPLQTRTEAAFRPPRAPRHAPQLPLIARQKADDQIPFLERPGLQDEGFAHTSGHICHMSETSESSMLTKVSVAGCFSAARSKWFSHFRSVDFFLKIFQKNPIK